MEASGSNTQSQKMGVKNTQLYLPISFYVVECFLFHYLQKVPIIPADGGISRTREVERL